MFVGIKKYVFHNLISEMVTPFFTWGFNSGHFSVSFDVFKSKFEQGVFEIF